MRLTPLASARRRQGRAAVPRLLEETQRLLGAAVLLGHQIAAAISSDRSVNRAIIAVTVLAIVVLGFFTRRSWGKLQAAMA